MAGKCPWYTLFALRPVAWQNGNNAVLHYVAVYFYLAIRVTVCPELVVYGDRQRVLAHSFWIDGSGVYGSR